MNWTAANRFAVWTVAVVVGAALPWVAAALLGRIPFGGCGNPLAVMYQIHAAGLFVPAVLSPPCVLPACVGYLRAAALAAPWRPDRVIPAEALSGYARLCGATLLAVAFETFSYVILRVAGGDRLLVLGAGVGGIVFVPVLLLWSTVVGTRITRIGRAVGFADSVCVRCGFVVSDPSSFGCPACGGEVCPTAASQQSAVR